MKGNPVNHRRIIIALLLVTSLWIGCGEKPRASKQQRYPLNGKVVSVRKDFHEVTVDHEEVPGFMGGMTMPYTVEDDKTLNSLKPGDRIHATLVVEDFHGSLENVQTEPALSAAPNSPTSSEKPDSKAAPGHIHRRRVED